MSPAQTTTHLILHPLQVPGHPAPLCIFLPAHLLRRIFKLLIPIFLQRVPRPRSRIGPELVCALERVEVVRLAVQLDKVVQDLEVGEVLGRVV